MKNALAERERTGKVEEEQKGPEEKKRGEEQTKKAEEEVNAVTAPPSALAIARIVEDLDHISYPKGVTGPKQGLNVNSKGRFM